MGWGWAVLSAGDASSGDGFGGMDQERPELMARVLRVGRDRSRLLRRTDGSRADDGWLGRKSNVLLVFPVLAHDDTGGFQSPRKGTYACVCVCVCA